MTIRAILFDKDGVFVDFEKTWAPAVRALAVDLNDGDEARAHDYLVAAGLDPVSGRFLPGSIWAAGHAIDLVRTWGALGDHGSEAELVARIDAHCAASVPEPVLPLAETKAVFEALRDTGYRLGVASNDSALSVRRTVERFGIDHLFETVLGYDSVANPKPSPDPLLAFAERVGVAPGEVAMVGDNGHDMHMAIAAGAGLRIGVLTGNSGHRDLVELAHHVVDDIRHVAALLGARGGAGAAVA